MALSEAYPDACIKTATQGTLFTQGLGGCFVILTYVETNGTRLASMGHHNRHNPEGIVRAWGLHKELHREMQSKSEKNTS